MGKKKMQVQTGLLLTWLIVGLPGAVLSGVVAQVLLDTFPLTAALFLFLEAMAVAMGYLCKVAGLVDGNMPWPDDRKKYRQGGHAR